MSKASVDLPEPLTPVTTLNRPRGMSTERFFRLCSRALTIWMLFDGDAGRPAAPSPAGRGSAATKRDGPIASS